MTMDGRDLPDGLKHPTFALNLKAWRRLRQLTAEELGDLSGYSKGNVSDWENEVRPPTYEAAVRLAKALRVPTPYLWDHLPPLPIEPAPEKRRPKRSAR